MRIKYLGPSDSVNVAPYGPHKKDKVIDYPDDFGEELLATSRKQKFEAVEDSSDEAKKKAEAEAEKKAEAEAKKKAEAEAKKKAEAEAKKKAEAEAAAKAKDKK